MTGRGWIDAVVAAGATAASVVPEPAPRTEHERAGRAELVEDTTLTIRSIAHAGWRPAAAAFLNGLQDWAIVAYDGIVPVLRCWVAAAVRRRGVDRKPRTAHEVGRELAITFPDRLSSHVRAALDASRVALHALDDERWGPPGTALAAARVALETERLRVEREVGAWWAEHAANGEWLVVDGVLSDHARLTSHPRAIGVVKNPGAQYFDGADLERVLTLPALHRSSVFQPAGRGAGPVYAWYVRLWPWEGHDLLHGLVRLECAAERDSLRQADAISSWVLSERAPLAIPGAHWHRLLYPLQDVETYLRTRAPAARPAAAAPPGRLPATPRPA
jgi:hypothetical protein